MKHWIHGLQTIVLTRLPSWSAVASLRDTAFHAARSSEPNVSFDSKARKTCCYSDGKGSSNDFETRPRDHLRLVA
jgi:hypothetical protein